MGYEGNYGKIKLQSGETVRCLIFSNDSEKAAMAITDQGKLIDIPWDIVRNEFKCIQVSGLVEYKMANFARRYSARGVDLKKDVKRMADDWAMVISEDYFTTELESAQIVNRRIQEMHGYIPQLVRLDIEEKCRLSLVLKVGMPVELSEYIAKCKLLGIESSEIKSSKVFKGIVEEVFNSCGVLYGERNDGYRSEITFDLRSNSILHVIGKNRSILKSRLSLEKEVDDYIRELRVKNE